MCSFSTTKGCGVERQPSCRILGRMAAARWRCERVVMSSSCTKRQWRALLLSALRANQAKQLARCRPDSRPTAFSGRPFSIHIRATVTQCVDRNTVLPPPLLSRQSRALPSYLWISVRAEAPRAGPVPAWPCPKSWSGAIAMQQFLSVRPVFRCGEVLQCQQGFISSSDILTPQSPVLLGILTPAVMQQEGTERRPSDVTASA